MIDLWLSTAANRPKGILTGMSEQDIALDAQWSGDPGEFCRALMEVGFLDRAENGTYSVHNWKDHQRYAYFAEERSQRAREAVEVRWSKRDAKRKKLQKECGDNTEGIQPVYGQNTEGNTPSPSPSPINTFSVFYEAYPKHEGKREALKAWQKIKLDNGQLEIILTAIEKQKKYKEHLKSKNQFYPEWPMPATWLNGQRWEDEIQEVKESW